MHMCDVRAVDCLLQAYLPVVTVWPPRSCRGPARPCLRSGSGRDKQKGTHNENHQSLKEKQAKKPQILSWHLLQTHTHTHVHAVHRHEHARMFVIPVHRYATSSCTCTNQGAIYSVAYIITHAAKGHIHHIQCNTNKVTLEQDI